MRRLMLELGKKLVLAVTTIIVVSAVTFCAVEVIPSDPAQTALGIEATEEQKQAFREKLQLDDPAPQRYLRWLGGMLQGDFGESVISGRPIGPDLAQRLRYTVLLALAALALASIAGLFIAIYAAQRPGRLVDSIASPAAVGAAAVPEFIHVILLVYVFALELAILPAISSGISRGDLVSLVLPSVALALPVGAYVYRVARVSVAETLGSTYVRTAVLNGLPRRRIIWLHVLPNASPVVINVIALVAIYLVGGVIIVEHMTAYPGLGTLLVAAIGAGDIVTVEAVAVILAAVFVTINFLADAAVLALNPRLRAR